MALLILYHCFPKYLTQRHIFKDKLQTKKNEEKLNPSVDSVKLLQEELEMNTIS